MRNAWEYYLYIRWYDYNLHPREWYPVEYALRKNHYEDKLSDHRAGTVALILAALLIGVIYAYSLPPLNRMNAKEPILFHIIAFFFILSSSFITSIILGKIYYRIFYFSFHENLVKILSFGIAAPLVLLQFRDWSYFKVIVGIIGFIIFITSFFYDYRDKIFNSIIFIIFACHLELSLLFLSIIFLYHTCDCENPFGYQRKTLDKKRFSKGLRIIRETNDQEILSFIARKSGNENICQYAVAKIHDQNLLSLILNDHNCLPGVRYQTRHKLKA